LIGTHCFLCTTGIHQDPPTDEEFSGIDWNDIDPQNGAQPFSVCTLQNPVLHTLYAFSQFIDVHYPQQERLKSCHHTHSTKILVSITRNSNPRIPVITRYQ
jgi:hypothetical protein